MNIYIIFHYKRKKIQKFNAASLHIFFIIIWIILYNLLYTNGSRHRTFFYTIRHFIVLSFTDEFFEMAHFRKRLQVIRRVCHFPICVFLTLCFICTLSAYNAHKTLEFDVPIFINTNSFPDCRLMYHFLEWFVFLIVFFVD